MCVMSYFVLDTMIYAHRHSQCMENFQWQKSIFCCVFTKLAKYHQLTMRIGQACSYKFDASAMHWIRFRSEKFLTHANNKIENVSHMFEKRITCQRVIRCSKRQTHYRAGIIVCDIFDKQIG